MWEIDEFIDMNPAGKGQKVSPLQHLLRIAATNVEFLNIASELLDVDTPSIVCFAQLPFSLVQKPQSMVRPGLTRLFELHFYPSMIVIQDDGSQQLLSHNQKPTDVENIYCTQALSVVKYWGVRAQWYPAYQHMVTESGLSKGEVVPTEESWLERHRPLDAATFENDIARRLLLENLEAIRNALPQEISKSYTTLLNYFIMPFSGRITFGNKLVPTLRYVQRAIHNVTPKSESRVIKMQSVFLSYGGPDEEKAEALRTDLAKKGVNTWWFPSDAQWGEKIYHEISRNIKIYDRLLLLCSRRSLIRNGVLHELEAVFEREAEEGGKAILIPVALDEVLDGKWWEFEPGPLGEPVKGKFDSKELSRRELLANNLKRRVTGDLKNAIPGDLKWKRALHHLLDILAPKEHS